MIINVCSRDSYPLQLYLVPLILDRDSSKRLRAYPDGPYRMVGTVEESKFRHLHFHTPIHFLCFSDNEFQV